LFKLRALPLLINYLSLSLCLLVKDVAQARDLFKKGSLFEGIILTIEELNKGKTNIILQF